MQYAARIITNVNDQTLHVLFLQIGQFFLKAFSGIQRELGDGNDTYTVILHVGIYSLEINVITHNCKFNQFCRTGTLHLHLGFTALWTSDFVNSLV
ncbi:hypothetical protein D3C76_1550430 [compost metagenome]